MNQLVNSALLSYYSNTGQIKPRKATKRRGASTHSYDTMSELERGELHQMLPDLSATRSVSVIAEELDGTHYEYDRNLKTTVKVTPDGERYPLTKLGATFECSPL
jgi:hypothetical protein